MFTGNGIIIIIILFVLLLLLLATTTAKRRQQHQQQQIQQQPDANRSGSSALLCRTFNQKSLGSKPFAAVSNIAQLRSRHIASVSLDAYLAITSLKNCVI